MRRYAVAAPADCRSTRTVARSAISLALLVPAQAQANAPFYWAAATLKFSVWWCIPATLVIEAIVLQRVLALTLRRAALASLVANFASAALGFIGAYLWPLALLDALFGNSPAVAAHPRLAELGAWFGAVAAVDAAVELLVLRAVMRLRPSPLGMLAIALANVFTVALCVGALAWPPPAASDVDRARVERAYAAEIAWMRGVLQAWPAHVRTDAGSRLVTEASFATATSEHARRMRFVAFSYIGPAGAYYPVMRENDLRNLRTVARTVDGEVVFERWEAASSRDEPIFLYELDSDRPDGRWRAVALFRDPPP